jgi:large subunit ribosomal protein L24
VQTTLLALAIAVILALVSALVAPLVIDWNRYRGAFEQEASRLTGLTVHVNGAIEARILPTPRIKLDDVEVGERAEPPHLQAAGIELEVGLTPLLRGKVQTTELRLVAPQINLGLDRSGAIEWPGPSPALRSDALTISRVEVENGRVLLSDARSGGRIILQKLRFDGDIHSFAGPFHGEGVFVVGSELYDYRISGGRADEDGGGLKLKLTVDPSNHPLTTAIDGTLHFDRGMPQFDGVLSLARPAGATLAGGERIMSDPWQLTGKVHATPETASLHDIALQYGPDERAVNLTGKAELTFGEHPHLGGNVAAVQIDVDRMLAAPDVTHRPPFVMLKNFLEAFVAAVKPPMPLSVGVAIDAVTVGGTTIQALHGGLGFDAGAWSLNDFAFRAPGFTDVNVSGRLDHGPQGLAFSGPARLQAADLKTLMAWLEGRSDQPTGPAEVLTARGAVTIASGRFVLDRLSAALDQENVEGGLAYTWANADHPASLDGELHAAKLNVDALIAFAKTAASDRALEVPHEIALVLDVGKATFAGVDARAVDARVKFDAGVLHIDRLSIGDLGGAALDVGGRIDDWSSLPRGRLTLDLNAKSLAGLTEVVSRFAPRVSDALRPFTDRLAPAKMHGALTVDRASALRPAGGDRTDAKLELGGDLGALRLTLTGTATGEAAKPGAAAVKVSSRLDADDGGALVQLLDLDRVLSVDQLPGQMTIAADGSLDGDLHLRGLATAGGFSAAAEGALHLSGEQAPSGNLQLKMSASDLRPLRRTMTGQPGPVGPISATAIVGVAGADLSVTDLAMTIGKSALRGRLDLKMANPVAISGDVAADDVDAASVAMQLLGLPGAAPGASKPWSSSPVGTGAFAALNGDVAFNFDRAILTPTLTARALTGIVHFQPPEIALRDIGGNLAGGRLGGELSFRRDAEKFSGQGHIELAGANAATLVGAENNGVDGLLTVKLQGDSAGLSPDGVVGSLHGSGTIALSKGQFAGIDPAVFDVAIRAADQSGSTEATRINPVVTAAMEKGRLTFAQGGAEVTIAAGQIRLANATLHGQGAAELALAGVLDLNKSAIDARMTLSEPAPANALIRTPPELTISIKGPLAAPERRLDVSALVGWLTLRATEQQTRRLESIEANRRADVSSPAVRPVSPSVRFIPPGVALEITKQASAPAATSAAHGFERLRPEAPAVMKPAAPHATLDADKPAATAGTAQQMPPPAARPPLDLLFHSQN